MINEKITDQTADVVISQVQSDNAEVGIVDFLENQTRKRPLFATIIMLLMYFYAIVFVAGGVIVATHGWHYNKGQTLLVLAFTVLFGLLHLSIGFAFKDGEKWGRHIISLFCLLTVLEFCLTTTRNGTPMVARPLGMFWVLPCFGIWILGFFEPLRGWMQIQKQSTSGHDTIPQKEVPRHEESRPGVTGRILLVIALIGLIICLVLVCIAYSRESWSQSPSSPPESLTLNQKDILFDGQNNINTNGVTFWGLRLNSVNPDSLLEKLASESYEAYARRTLPDIYPERCYDYTNCNGIVMKPVLLKKPFFGSSHALVMMDGKNKHALSFIMFCDVDSSNTNDVVVLVSRIMGVFGRKYGINFKTGNPDSVFPSNFYKMRTLVGDTVEMATYHISEAVTELLSCTTQDYVIWIQGFVVKKEPIARLNRLQKAALIRWGMKREEDFMALENRESAVIPFNIGSITDCAPQRVIPCPSRESVLRTAYQTDPYEASDIMCRTAAQKLVSLIMGEENAKKDYNGQLWSGGELYNRQGQGKSYLLNVKYVISKCPGANELFFDGFRPLIPVRGIISAENKDELGASTGVVGIFIMVPALGERMSEIKMRYEKCEKGKVKRDREKAERQRIIEDQKAYDAL